VLEYPKVPMSLAIHENALVLLQRQHRWNKMRIECRGDSLKTGSTTCLPLT
jgi:hypothetical protein